MLLTCFLISLFSSLLVYAVPLPPVKDVPLRLQPTITTLWELGVIQDSPDGRFHPYSNCTYREAVIALRRAMFGDPMPPPPDRPRVSERAKEMRAAMKFLIEDLHPLDATTPERLKVRLGRSKAVVRLKSALAGDDDVNQEFVDVLAKLVEMGVVTGDAGGIVEADRAISREQFIALLVRLVYRMDVYVDVDYHKTHFADFDDRRWSLGPIMVAAGAGLIEGRSGKKLHPTEPMKRYELAIILSRIIRAGKALWD